MGCIIGDLKYIVKVADNIAKDEMKKQNIPVLSQHAIIFHMINEQHILFSDLQTELQTSKSTLSDAIHKYEELGLIEKFECEKDKRNLYVGLTDEGKAIWKQIAEIDELIKDVLFKDFELSERTQTEINVHRIMENLK